jgi:hypothetical protein
MSQPILKAVAGVAALAAIAFGASAIASGSNHRSGAGGAAAAFGGPPGPGPGARNGAAPGTRNGLPPAGANGAPPPGAGPGMGQPVTSATAAKVKAVALARYPGTIERIDQVPGLGYVAHVFRSGGGGEVHVLVTKRFQVKGLAPDPRQGPPATGVPPAGSPPGAS